MGGTIVDSKKDIERTTIGEKEGGRERREKELITFFMMIKGLLWAILFLSFKEAV